MFSPWLLVVFVEPLAFLAEFLWIWENLALEHTWNPETIQWSAFSLLTVWHKVNLVGISHLDVWWCLILCVAHCRGETPGFLIYPLLGYGAKCLGSIVLSLKMGLPVDLSFQERRAWHPTGGQDMLTVLLSFFTCFLICLPLRLSAPWGGQGTSVLCMALPLVPSELPDRQRVLDKYI